jgi:hypothetical protein
MKPFLFNPNQAFNLENFSQLLLEMCEEHHENNRAFAFAFIVYDYEDAAIQNIIENKKYWAALDKISGGYLTIFYINPNNDYYDRRQREIYQEMQNQQNRIEMMQPLRYEETDLEKSIEYLNTTFGFDENLKHPFILFFQTDGEQIINYFIIRLKEKKFQESFLEITRQIKNAVKSLSQVTPDNFNNRKEIFSLIKDGVKGGNINNFIKTEIIPKIGIDKIFSFLKIIAGSK